MNNIITINKLESLTSMEVSNMVGKEHNKLMRDIRRYINQLGEAKIGHSDFFQESTYISEQNKELPCFNITRKGCEFIANKLTGQKGTEFTAKYVNRFHELEEGNIANTLITTLNSISEAMLEIKNSTNEQLISITNRLDKLEHSQRNRYLLEKRYPSAWYKKIAPKYKMLMEYFDCSRSELYSSIYKELEDTYDVDINQIHEDYCYENHLLKDECYPMDAIEHNTKLRDALTLLIDSSLVKYGLQTEDEIKNFKRKTLFDKKPTSYSECRNNS